MTDGRCFIYRYYYHLEAFLYFGQDDQIFDRVLYKIKSFLLKQHGYSGKRRDREVVNYLLIKLGKTRQYVIKWYSQLLKPIGYKSTWNRLGNRLSLEFSQISPNFKWLQWCGIVPLFYLWTWIWIQKPFILPLSLNWI